MDELATSKKLLDDFFNQVRKLEGTLAGGEKLDLGKGGEALHKIRETKIKLGNPRDKLIQLTPKLFEEVGFAPGDIHKRQRFDQYDFYYITVPVNLFGSPGVQFDDLICELDFGPKGEKEPIIQAMFPSGEWHDVLMLEAGSSLAVDVDFGWQVGLSSKEDELQKLIANIPAPISGNVLNKNNMHGRVVVPKFNFSIGRKEISAAGLYNSQCRWTISKPELHREDNIEFGVVFKVPKNSKSIDLTAIITARPSLSWLASQLRHLASTLAMKFKDVVNGKTPLPVGDGEEWKSLKLSLKK